MGIDIESAIMVGLPREELGNLDILEDFIDGEELECCPYCYDGDGNDDSIVGFAFKRSDSWPSELEWDQTKIDELKVKFKDVTGQDAKVWLSPWVW